MTDLNCSQCGEPWDVYGLKEESIGYLTVEQAGSLVPLGNTEQALDYIARALGSGRAHDLRVALTAAVPDTGAAGDPATPVALAELFTWWWEKSDLDSEKAKAAATVVQNAIYAAVANGQGCPSCGFDHAKIGLHRETTLRQLVDGVDDTDPTPHILYDQRER